MSTESRAQIRGPGGRCRLSLRSPLRSLRALSRPRERDAILRRPQASARGTSQTSFLRALLQPRSGQRSRERTPIETNGLCDLPQHVPRTPGGTHAHGSRDTDAFVQFRPRRSRSVRDGTGPRAESRSHLRRLGGQRLWVATGSRPQDMNRTTSAAFQSSLPTLVNPQPSLAAQGRGAS